MNIDNFTNIQIITFLGLVVANLADVITTNRALARPGTREANGFIAAIMRKLGRFWGVPKLLIAIAAAAYLAINDLLIVTWCLTALVAFIAYRNTKVGRK